MPGLLCRLCGVSLSLRWDVTRQTSHLTLQVENCWGLVFVLCQLGLVPPFTKPGWTLTPVPRGEGGAGLDGTSQGPFAGGWAGRTFLSPMRWESFLWQSFHCWPSNASHIARPRLTCYGTGFWGHLVTLFESFPLVFSPFNTHYSYYFYHLLQCISRVSSPLTKLVFVFPGHSELAGEMWPKLCTAKEPPIPGVWIWFGKDFGNSW